MIKKNTKLPVAMWGLKNADGYVIYVSTSRAYLRGARCVGDKLIRVLVSEVKK